MQCEPIARQLRYLQTLGLIAADKNTTTIFPFPLELVKPFLEQLTKGQKNDSKLED